MKLLLTSAGLTNPSIVNALGELLGKSAQGVRLAFIPTAANVEDGDKHWLIDDFDHFREVGLAVDIVDISAVDQSVWQPRLEEAEVLCFGGGNTFHLRYWLEQSGLAAMLPALLRTRVWVGISAGSCVASPTIVNPVQNLFAEQYEPKLQAGLALVDVQFVPHLNSTYFPTIRHDALEQAAKAMSVPVYALDDESALVVNDGKIAVVSEGEWLQFN